MKKIVNNLMLGSLAAMVLGLTLVGCDRVVHEAVTFGRIITGDIEIDFDEAEHQKTEILRAEEERLKRRALEKEKMSALAPTDKPATQPAGPEEAAHYVDEPEQTAVSNEKKYLNIAGRWVGTYTITDHTGPDYGGVTYEYGTNLSSRQNYNYAGSSTSSFSIIKR